MRNRNNAQARPEKRDIQNSTSKNTVKFKFDFEVIASERDKDSDKLKESFKREWKGSGEITAEQLSHFVAEFVGHTAKNFVESHTTRNEDNDFEEVK
jgi:hypothetical protein